MNQTPPASLILPQSASKLAASSLGEGAFTGMAAHAALNNFGYLPCEGEA